MRYSRVLAPLLLVTSVVSAQAKDNLAERLSELGAVQCEDSELTCVTLHMPLDRAASDPDRTVDITFAISLATGDTKGILFFFVGGPGGAGIATAQDYLPYYSEDLVSQMDIVFVDQRGTGPVHGLNCPIAQAKLDLGDLSLDRAEQALDLVRTYVDGCIAELDQGDFLAHVSTDDAIADFEAFRQAIGAPKVWLYGESYGTQVVQTYATQHPEAVAGAIIDGVVDLNLSLEAFYASYSGASEALLDRLFAECRAVTDCAADMLRDPADVYDAIAAELAQTPLAVDFVLSDGMVAKRQLNEAMFTGAAFGALYNPSGRSSFLRAMAAASRGDYVPLLLSGYDWHVIEPQTEEVKLDPTWFPAAYYAISCSDYGHGTGTPDENARSILDEARAIAPQRPRLLRTYYLERLVCAYWPHHAEEERPAQFVGGDYPTFVLNGDGDPITPISMAYSVLDNVKNGHGIFQKGGPHVIFGWGNSCPDNAVYAALLEGTLPPARELQCEVDFIDGYTPLTLTGSGATADPLAVVQAVETEVAQSLELGLWDGVDAITIGCNRGGTLTATPTDRGTDYAFAGCAFWPGLSVTGTGASIAEDGAEDGMTLELEVSGDHAGQLSYYHNTQDASWYLTGQYDRKEVITPRTHP